MVRGLVAATAALIRLTCSTAASSTGSESTTKQPAQPQVSWLSLRIPNQPGPPVSDAAGLACLTALVRRTSIPRT
jgi:hypothetical protein